MNELSNKSMEELLVLAEHDPEAQFQLGTIYSDFRYWLFHPRQHAALEEIFGEPIGQPDTARKEESSGETASQPDTAEIRLPKTQEEREKLAEEWFRKAAEGGHAEAMFRLGELHTGGRYRERLLNKEDREQAEEWYRRAAERGHVEAMFQLGELYRPGDGLPLYPVSWPRAAEWYRKAAELGHVQAMVRFGEYCGISCITEGKDEGTIRRFGVRMYQDMAFDHQEKEADPEQAFYWYHKAAELGDATAQREVGGCYLYGLGVERDEAQAVEWYRKAAELGDSDAHWKIGDCYLYGRGVEQDEAQAVEWYLKVSGNSTAQWKLGDCYLYGTGVEEDEAQAVEWYRASAEQGDFNAIDALKELGINEYW